MSLKEAAKGNGFKFVWHCNGKVMVRRGEQDRVHIITSVGDLAVIIGSSGGSVPHIGPTYGASLGDPML